MGRDWAYLAGQLGIPNAIPVGTVLPYAGPLADTDKHPAGLDLAQVRARLAAIGWLACDGRMLACNEYRLLYGVIGNAFGGDGVHFRLPDLRGRFVRGVDGGSGRDPASDQRTASEDGGNTGDQVGSVQRDAFQGHEHNYLNVAATLEAEAGAAPVYCPAETTAATSGQVADDAGHGTPRVDSETRPVNLYLNHIIRFR